MTGPPFLKLPETKWPQFQDDDQNPNKERKDALKERKTSPKQVDKGEDKIREVHATSVSEGKEDNSISPHLLERCSTFTKVRRVLAYVHHFVECTRRKDVPNGSLTVQGFMQSELQLLKWSKKHLNVQGLDKKLVTNMDEDRLREPMAASKMRESWKQNSIWLNPRFFNNLLNVVMVWPRTEQTGAWDELKGDLSCDVVLGIAIYVFHDVATFCGYAPSRDKSKSLERYLAQFALM